MFVSRCFKKEQVFICTSVGVGDCHLDPRVLLPSHQQHVQGVLVKNRSDTPLPIFEIQTGGILKLSKNNSRPLSWRKGVAIVFSALELSRIFPEREGCYYRTRERRFSGRFGPRAFRKLSVGRQRPFTVIEKAVNSAEKRSHAHVVLS